MAELVRVVRVVEFVDLLGELAGGGLVIVDRLGDDPDEPDAPVGFRTLVQLDGDVVFSVSAAALAREDFAAAFARHSERVRALLSEKRARLRLLSRLLIRRGRMIGFAVGLGSGGWYGELKVVLVNLSSEVTMVAAASVGAVLFGAIGRASVRVVLRRRGFGRYRLHELAGEQGDDDG